MLTFNALGISPNLLKGIGELGFTNPTPIQEQVIPIVLETQSDLIGLAQTGTGKTAAFGLPLIEQVNLKNRSVQVLILAPTRELCIQISKDLNSFSKYTKELTVVPVYGGASIDQQISALRRGAHIIAATPGRMLDLIKRRAADISGIKTVVLDEADEMLNMGFREELDSILETTPAAKRTLLFSATMSKDVTRIAGNYLHDPVKITIGKQNAGAENIRHIYYLVHATDRYQTLKRVADINPDIYGLVFCRTRMETKDVADKLIKDGYNADALHGDLSQAQRDHVMKRFRERSLQMLVATDVAARGIDVNDITHVINYNLPEELEVYNHRSGRTGRANKSGVAISIVNYREKSRIPQIERMISHSIEKMPVPTGDEICKKQLFNLIDRMENVDIDEEQIAPFMATVNKKLEWLSKEQIIKHFVSLEFNRFLEYYKNAPDLNAKTGGEKGDFRDGRTEGRRRDRSGRRESSGFNRFFLNMGKKDGLIPKNVIGMINDNTRDRSVNIGTIDIKDSFTFFEVGEESSSKILDALKNHRFKGRRVKVELVNNNAGSDFRDKDNAKKGKKRKKK